jgi:quinol monooxygenase YgiN
MRLPYIRYTNLKSRIDMIVIIGRTTFKTISDRDESLAALMAAAAPTLQEPGVMVYKSTIDPKDPLVLHAVEIYSSQEAVYSHIYSEHMATLVAAISHIEADVKLKGFEGDLTPCDLSVFFGASGGHEGSKIALSVEQ